MASRKPEKYSSAAPLVADARQRIVAEYVSLADGITCSMFVGPATGSLERTEQEDWTASAVANVVLSDRSAVRCSLAALRFKIYWCLSSATSLVGPVCWPLKRNNHQHGLENDDGACLCMISTTSRQLKEN